MKAVPADSRSTAASLARWVATIGLCWVAWRALTLGVADHFARQDPVTALQWRPEHVEALLAAASRDVDADPRGAASLARRALRSNPLQGIAYRVLATSSEANEDKAGLYAIATARAPRDIPGLAWQADRAMAAGDVAGALKHLDQMLRVEPGMADALYPAFEFIASRPEGRASLAVLLLRSPPWRSTVLGLLAQRTTDPAAIAGLFEQLRTSAAGLSKAELGAWLDRLLKARQWGSAYLFWASQLPEFQRRKIGNVFDGGFEWVPTHLGFDWRQSRVAGAYIDRSSTDGVSGASALRVAFDHQRVPFNHVSQLLALPAGRYRLEGRARLESLQTSRGLVWSLDCAEDNIALARTSAFSGSQPWQPFAVDFEIPVGGCGAQWLRLQLAARIPAEQYIGGTAWFDDLRILRDP